MTGISLSNGIAYGVNGLTMLYSGCGVSTRCDKKLVSPNEKKLIAKPTITWSTRKRMANTASSADNATPITIAPSTPAHGPYSEPITAPANAPPSNWPSIAILMTPLRSHRIPAIAPRVMGTLRVTVSCNMPVRLNEPPEVAHARKPTTNAAVEMARITLVHLPKPRYNWTAPSAPSITASTRANGCDGRTSVKESTSLKPASPGRPEKKNAEISARNISEKPTLRARFRCSFDSNGVAVSTAILMTPTP